MIAFGKTILENIQLLSVNPLASTCIQYKEHKQHAHILLWQSTGVLHANHAYSVSQENNGQRNHSSFTDA